MQAVQLHQELQTLSKKYGESASASRLQAITSLAVTLVFVVGCNMVAYGALSSPAQKNWQELFLTVGKNSSEVGKAAQNYFADPKKVRADGEAGMLNTKISDRQQGSSSAKAAEEAIQQAAAAAAQAFQRSISISG
jgi:hypothetical protein